MGVRREVRGEESERIEDPHARVFAHPGLAFSRQAGAELRESLYERGGNVVLAPSLRKSLPDGAFWNTVDSNPAKESYGLDRLEKTHDPGAATAPVERFRHDDLRAVCDEELFEASYPGGVILGFAEPPHSQAVR